MARTTTENVRTYYFWGDDVSAVEVKGNRVKIVNLNKKGIFATIYSFFYRGNVKNWSFKDAEKIRLKNKKEFKLWLRLKGYDIRR